MSEAIGLSKKGTIAAGLMISLYPILLFYPIALVSENLFIPLFAWSIYIAWKLKKKPSSIWLYILLGVLLGMMVLTRSISILILLFIIGWLFFTLKRLRVKSLIPLVIAMLFIVPWSIRNSAVMGHPAFVENSLWYNMYIGYHPEGSGNFESDIAIKPLFITDDAERDAFCKTQAINFIKADPVEALRRIINRIPAFFGPETRAFNYFYGNNLLGPIAQPWITLIYLLLTLPWFFICLFGTIGLIDSRNRPLAILVGFTALIYFLPHLPIVTEPRFHLTLVPLLAPFAIDAVTKKNNGNEMDRKHKGRWVIIALIVIFFVVVWTLKIHEDMPLYLRLLAPGGNKIGLSY